MQLLFEIRPFSFTIVTSKPNLVVSKGFIKCHLLPKCLYKSFNTIECLQPWLILFLPILDAIIGFIFIRAFVFLVFEAHVSIRSFRNLLIIIIVALSRSERNWNMTLYISNALKRQTLIGSCVFFRYILIPYFSNRSFPININWSFMAWIRNWWRFCTNF